MRAARPYKLAPADLDVAHADPWDEGVIGRFEARVRRIRDAGLEAVDAEDLAEALHLRDVHADYRHLCLECVRYRPGRCGSHKRAGLSTADVSIGLATTFQHCAGFVPDGSNAWR